MSGKRGKGIFALVDDDMFDHLSQWRWNLNDGYATAAIRTSPITEKYGFKVVGMHRMVIQAPDGIKVDHKDRNRLHNTRANLRLCNSTESSRNRGIQSNNISGCSGVFWKADRRRWGAVAWVNGGQINIGTFKCKEEASYVRDQFILQLYGEFASLNTPFN